MVRTTITHATVPADAVLHLHDRDWVYTPSATAGVFKRIEVTGGAMLPGNLQEINSGIEPGHKGRDQRACVAEYGGTVDAAWRSRFCAE